MGKGDEKTCIYFYDVQSYCAWPKTRVGKCHFLEINVVDSQVLYSPCFYVAVVLELSDECEGLTISVPPTLFPILSRPLSPKHCSEKALSRRKLGL